MKETFTLDNVGLHQVTIKGVTGEYSFQEDELPFTLFL